MVSHITLNLMSYVRQHKSTATLERLQLRSLRVQHHIQLQSQHGPALRTFQHHHVENVTEHVERLR